MWKRILATAHRLGFTRNETLVLLFLVAVISVGSLISALRPADARGSADIRASYDETDSVFAERSRAQFTEAQETAEAESLPGDPSVDANGNLVNLNTATAQRLMSLPGIGPVTADRILEYRRTHGPFQTVDDLVKVKSIGEKKLQRIRQFITVE